MPAGGHLHPPKLAFQYYIIWNPTILGDQIWTEYFREFYVQPFEMEPFGFETFEFETFGFETFYFKRNIFRDFPSIPSKLNLSEGKVYNNLLPNSNPNIIAIIENQLNP